MNEEITRHRIHAMCEGASAERRLGDASPAADDRLQGLGENIGNEGHKQ